MELSGHLDAADTCTSSGWPEGGAEAQGDDHPSGDGEGALSNRLREWPLRGTGTVDDHPACDGNSTRCVRLDDGRGIVWYDLGDDDDSTEYGQTNRKTRNQTAMAGRTTNLRTFWYILLQLLGHGFPYQCVAYTRDLSGSGRGWCLMLERAEHDADLILRQEIRMDTGSATRLIVDIPVSQAVIVLYPAS